MGEIGKISVIHGFLNPNSAELAFQPLFFVAAPPQYTYKSGLSCAHSSMDRMAASEAVDTGSTPVGRTIFPSLEKSRRELDR